MKVDISRVLALAEALPKSRLPGTQGERQAADMVAASFEAAGLQVERIAYPLNPYRPWKFAIALSFILALVIFSTNIDLRAFHRACLIALLVPPLFLGAWWAGRRSRLAGLSVTERSQHVIGIPIMKEVPPIRIILHTDSASSNAISIQVMHFIFTFLILIEGILSCAILMSWYEGQGILGLDFTLGQLGGVWLSSLLMLLVPMLRPARPKRGDNRTGLALLLELAKNWPTNLAEKVETVFVASPKPDSLALRIYLTSQSTRARPTLVIKLDAPGVGPELVIAGRGIAYQIATAAARDLCIPHRSTPITFGLVFTPLRATSRRFGLVFTSLRAPEASYVGIRGKHDDSPIDPALLSATAQVVMETTLRWIKQAMPAKAPLDRDALE